MDVFVLKIVAIACCVIIVACFTKAFRSSSSFAGRAVPVATVFVAPALVALVTKIGMDTSGSFFIDDTKRVLSAVLANVIFSLGVSGWMLFIAREEREGCTD